MPSIEQPPAGSPVPHNDDLNELLDDDAIDAFMRDLNVPSAQNTSAQHGSTSQGRQNANANASGSGLGIDDEVQIGKKRQPIAKLDEDRILSAKGIPKLRKVTKDRLKFKGKGHEFSDIARMLNMYQLWLDDLYPRAKLLDGLTMVEKLGHKKRLQVMRKQWIDEGKPKLFSAEDEDEEMLDDARIPAQDPEPIFAQTDAQPEQQHDDNGLNADESPDGDAPDDDELDALLAEQRDTMPSQPQRNVGGNGAPGKDADDPDEDELDALLAEEAPSQPPQPKSLFGDGLPTKQTVQQPEDEYADDMAAMAEMGGW